MKRPKIRENRENDGDGTCLDNLLALSCRIFMKLMDQTNVKLTEEVLVIIISIKYARVC